MYQESDVDPICKVICFPSLDFEDLSPDEIAPADPIGSFFEKVADELWLAKNSNSHSDPAWSEIIGSTDVPGIVKYEDTPSQGKTMAKRLGITKTRIIEVDGERQLHAFNCNGELVDMRILYGREEED